MYNLPLFVLEGMALRELKKLMYLKQLDCERLQKEGMDSTAPDPDYYDSINFEDEIYKDTSKTVKDMISLSHLNELFECILFNSNEKYVKMDYDQVTSKDRLNPKPVGYRLADLFGTREEYYKEIAQAFYCEPENQAIWKSKKELNLNLSWLNMNDRRFKKNVWGEVKKLFKQISTDPALSSKDQYDKITLGQLLLFIVLDRIRKRVVIFNNKE
jgi:hypothetical protein